MGSIAQGRDLHVVERVLKGDAEVYRILVERYRTHALAHAHAMTDDARLAEAAVDEAFLAAFHGLSTISDRSNFRPFLYRELRKRLSMAAESVRAEPLSQADLDALHGVLVDRLRSLDAAPAVRRALLRLSVDKREIWSLRYVARLPVEEIAEVLHFDPQALTERVAAVAANIRDSVTQGAAENVGSEPTVPPVLDDLAPPDVHPESGGEEQP